VIRPFFVCFLVYIAIIDNINDLFSVLFIPSPLLSDFSNDAFPLLLLLYTFSRDPKPRVNKTSSSSCKLGRCLPTSFFQVFVTLVELAGEFSRLLRSALSTGMMVVHRVLGANYLIATIWVLQLLPVLVALPVVIGPTGT